MNETTEPRRFTIGSEPDQHIQTCHVGQYVTAETRPHVWPPLNNGIAVVEIVRGLAIQAVDPEAMRAVAAAFWTAADFLEAWQEERDAAHQRAVRFAARRLHAVAPATANRAMASLEAGRVDEVGLSLVEAAVLPSDLEADRKTVLDAMRALADDAPAAQS